jgi:nicotinamidase/pyrazinamidase
VGTPGQAKLSETLCSRHVVIEPDQQTDRLDQLFASHAQLIFHKVTTAVWAHPSAVRLVELLDVGEYVVFGVATEICVRAAVLGLRSQGWRVTVVGDAVRAIRDEAGQAARAEMQSAGARWVTTEQVVGEKE